MKKLLFILMFVPLVSFGQEEPIKVQVEQVPNVAQSIQAGAAARAARAAEAAAMSEPSLETKTPLTDDLYKYTHIALVDVTNANYFGNQYSNSGSYKDMASSLANSPLTVINPKEYDKKKFKKNKRFLRDIKNPSWLYFYYRASMQGVDNIHSLVIRDSNNKIIYNVAGTNIPFDEMLSVLTEM